MCAVNQQFPPLIFWHAFYLVCLFNKFVDCRWGIEMKQLQSIIYFSSMQHSLVIWTAHTLQTRVWNQSQALTSATEILDFFFFPDRILVFDGLKNARRYHYVQVYLLGIVIWSCCRPRLQSRWHKFPWRCGPLIEAVSSTGVRKPSGTSFQPGI